MIYVADIQGTGLVLMTTCEDVPFDWASLGASGSPEERGGVLMTSPEQLGASLERLRDAGVLFLETLAGWPPAAVFEDLREKGRVHGPFDAISFSGPGLWSVRRGR